MNVYETDNLNSRKPMFMEIKKNIGLWSVILWLTVMLRKIKPLLQVLTQSGLISTLEVKRSSKLEH